MGSIDGLVDFMVSTGLSLTESDLKTVLHQVRSRTNCSEGNHVVNSSLALNGHGGDDPEIDLLGQGTVCIFVGGVLFFVFYMLLLVRKESLRYRNITGAEELGTFTQYMFYRFAYWYTWTPGSAGIVLFSASLILLVFGGLLLRICLNKSLAESLWIAWIWVAAPDGGGSAETSTGRAIGMLTSVGGMLIFALLMSVISDQFHGVLQGLREGRLPIIEGNHFVILGYATPALKVIIEEICIAEESSGGTVIAILTPTEKIQVEEYLMDDEVNFRNSSILVQCGKLRNSHDLRKVGVPSAAKVIITSRPGVTREAADSGTLNVLLTLKNHGWPYNGMCVVQCELLRNTQLFERLTNNHSKVLTTGDFVHGLLVQCSKQRGLTNIIRSIFGFEGDEFYVEHVDGIAGLTFLEVLLSLPHVCLLGYVDQTGAMELLPLMERKFHGDERLVMLAEDSTTVPKTVVRDGVHSYSSAELSSAVSKGEVTGRVAYGMSTTVQTIIILGWNDQIGAVLVELDHILAEGSSVIIHSPKSENDRHKFLESAQKRRRHRFQMTITHHEGPLGARFKLEDLPFEHASTVLILGEVSSDTSAAEADAETMAAVVQVQDILRRRCGNKADTAIIMPQLLDLSTEEACVKMGIHDYLMSNRLTARIMALVSIVPQVSGIIAQLSKENGCHFKVRELCEYPAASDLALEDGICWKDVVAMVALSNEVALGWSEVGAGSTGPWELNPKHCYQKRAWPREARVVVAAREDYVRLANEDQKAVSRSHVWAVICDELEEADEQRKRSAAVSNRRRKGFSAERTSEDDIKMFELPVYRKPIVVKRKLATAVLNCSSMKVLGLRCLTEKHIEEIVMAFQGITMSEGENMMKIGDLSHCLYVVEDGHFESFVLRPGDDGKSVSELKLANLGPGSIFGEPALMCPSECPSTVKCVTATAKVWALERECFQMILKKCGIDQVERYSGWLTQVDMLRVLNGHEISQLASVCENMDLEEGETIIQEGEAGDAMYLLEEGTCAAFKVMADGTEKMVKKYQKQGDYFGELAIINNAPRLATVKAISEAVVLKIGRRTFDDLLGPIGHRLQERAGDYPHYSEALKHEDTFMTPREYLATEETQDEDLSPTCSLSFQGLSWRRCTSEPCNPFFGGQKTFRRSMRIAPSSNGLEDANIEISPNTSKWGPELTVDPSCCSGDDTLSSTELPPRAPGSSWSRGSVGSRGSVDTDGLSTISSVSRHMTGDTEAFSPAQRQRHRYDFGISIRTHKCVNCRKIVHNRGCRHCRVCFCRPCFLNHDCPSNRTICESITENRATARTM